MSNAPGSELPMVTSSRPSTLPLSETTSTAQVSPFAVRLLATCAPETSSRTAPFVDHRSVTLAASVVATRSSAVFGALGLIVTSATSGSITTSPQPQSTQNETIAIRTALMARVCQGHRRLGGDLRQV